MGLGVAGSIGTVGRWEQWLAGSIGVASLIIVVGRLSLWLSCGFSEWLGLCSGFVMGCLSPRLCGGFSVWLGLCGGFVVGLLLVVVVVRLWNSVVQLFHRHRVIHRDLKPENFLCFWVFGYGCGFECLAIAMVFCELFVVVECFYGCTWVEIGYIILMCYTLK